MRMRGGGGISRQLNGGVKGRETESESERGAEFRQPEALRKSFSFCANKLDYSITCLYPANR